jgi:pimeloyl-ACP methyl ester carboxylesterase
MCSGSRSHRSSRVPNATNALDGCSIYYEDDGGSGAPVLLYGGILDTVELVRASQIGCVLTDFPDEFRLIYADHRGLGRSDKPHELGAYSMPLQVADTVAVLDELSLERALSSGGRTARASPSASPSMLPSACSLSLRAASSRTR